jgi:hypothetical protein
MFRLRNYRMDFYDDWYWKPTPKIAGWVFDFRAHQFTRTLDIIKQKENFTWTNYRNKNWYMTYRNLLWDLRFSRQWILKITIFWNVTPCSLVDGYRQSRGTSLPLVIYQTKRRHIPDAYSFDKWLLLETFSKRIQRAVLHSSARVGNCSVSNRRGHGSLNRSSTVPVWFSLLRYQ